MNARVLVTGVGGPAGRSLARQLVSRGVAVVGVDMAVTELADVTFHSVPAANDPGFVTALIRLIDAERIDVVVPTVTEELIVLADDPQCAAPVVVSPGSGVRVANDKLLTCRRLAAAGLAVPRYLVPGDLPDVDIVALLGEPYLSKPRVSRGGRGVTVHRSGTPRPVGAGLLLQEFVPGVEYTVNLYVADNPDCDVAVVLEKTALAQGIVGNAVTVRVEPSDEAADVARLAIAAARALDLRGPVDIDVRRRRDGTPVVLEINARFGANSAYAPQVLDALMRDFLPDLAPVG